MSGGSVGGSEETGDDYGAAWCVYLCVGCGGERGRFRVEERRRRKRRREGKAENRRRKDGVGERNFACGL